MIKPIHTSSLAFKQRENIDNYLSTCAKLKGFNPVNLFETVDLYERDRPAPVFQNLIRLRNLARDNDGKVVEIGRASCRERVLLMV